MLGNLIATEMIPVVQLNEIFRQSMQSLIVTNAHKIVAGQMPDLHIKSSDFFFLPYHDGKMISSVLVDLCARRLPASYGYSVWSEIQVLSPSRKGARYDRIKPKTTRSHQSERSRKARDSNKRDNPPGTG